jgi:transposase-like protein
VKSWNSTIKANCFPAKSGRGNERINQHNGYRDRAWETRAGTVELRIPKLSKRIALAIMFQAWDRTTQSYSLHSRSHGSYQEIRQGNSIASEPSSSNPHLKRGF